MSTQKDAERARIGTALARAESSYRILFAAESTDAFTEARDISFVKLLGELIAGIRADYEHPSEGGILFCPASSTRDVPDILNALCELSYQAPFSSMLDKVLFDSLRAKNPPESAESFYFDHCHQFLEAVSSIIQDYVLSLRSRASKLPTPDPNIFTDRLPPQIDHLTTKNTVFARLKLPALRMELRKKADGFDPFRKSRVYRHSNGKFMPVELPAIRKVDEFFGYQDARRVFLEHYKDFSDGKSNLPLLISSLPGLGKTQMSIAHSLKYDNITLIIAEATDIEQGLENLVRYLGGFPLHRFVIFFDDIDAARTNWYYFRANVGGTFSLPMNITVTIASNQRFPANILSRGRGFEFHIFDEIRCQEMISDFLTARGMKCPSPDLVAVIASDYVEQFGQKMFEELSPRTLIRYLDVFMQDGKRRRDMLEKSKGELIVHPDALVFYEENVKLLQSIHGEDAVREMTEKDMNA